MELGETEAAECALLRALVCAPDLQPPYILLSCLAMTQYKWDDVEYRARQALRIEENAEAYNLLGLALDRLDRPQEASAAYTRGIELGPECEVLYCNFGRLVRRSDLAKAEILFCKAIELNPDFARAHLEMGSLLLRQEVLDESEYHLRRAIELDPAEPYAHLYLGNLLQMKNDIPAAAVEFQWAYHAAPDWPETMWCLADISAAQEEWAKAEDLYNRALAVEPDFIPANRGLANMYMSMGKTQLADTYFRRVLLLDPHDQTALDCLETIAGDDRLMPQRLAHRLQRRRPRWQRRHDPDAR